MKESDNIEEKKDISLTTQNINKSEESLSISTNKLVNSKINETSETLEIKPKKLKSEFELHIIEAYKIIAGFYQKNESKKDKNYKDNIINIQSCEKEIRIALNRCIESPNIKLNKNTLDKISRIILHNNINILLIMGKIFINLMNKEKLFDPSDKNIDLNIIISFINEVCNLNNILKETYLGNKLNQISIKFIEKMITDFNFKEEQINAMRHLINVNTIKQNSTKININSYEEMVMSILDLVQSQENYYMQYKVVINNYDFIMGMIHQTDLGEQNISNYIELGKIFAYLLYNKKYVIFMKKFANENEQQGVITLLFDGYEDNYLLNIVEGEKYYIDYDEDIEEMRKKLSELILKYAEKYKTIANIYDLQYVLYVLVKRVYFHYYEKFKERAEPILAEIMINLCFYKVDSIEEVKIFMHEILNSDDEKNKNLKNLLNRKLDFVKMNPNFQYKQHSKDDENDENNNNNYFTSIENISNETILLLESDLKLGFFLSKTIPSGDTFTFYVELSESYGLLDFCLNIDEYNIKLSITNLTEGKEIIKSNEINAITSPFKLAMFYTKPVICKFEFDNSYSWIRDKNIKYKVNIFYPQQPFYIGRQILLLEYQETIYNSKNNDNEDNNKEDKNNGKNMMFLVKFNGQNRAFNCFEVMKNIETSNKKIVDNFIAINSIFIEKNKDGEKSFFYYYNKDNNSGLNKIELTKENFVNYIKNNILKESNSKIDIVNLYIISGDSNIIDNHYITIEEILGFVPDIKTESINNYNNYKLLFFLQYLHQSQLIYALYKYICSKESYDIVILINYTKYGGYQICLYKNGEIFINPKDFKKINKNETLENNIKYLCEEIKKYGNKRRVDILITESIDTEEKEFNTELICELINKNLNINDENENNYKIKKMGHEFSNEVSNNSHIFYLE